MLSKQLCRALRTLHHTSPLGWWVWGSESNEPTRSHRSSYRQAIGYGEPSSAIFLVFFAPETV